MRAAIGELASRAEADPVGDVLSATYVDPRLTEQLATSNHQLLFGRRGTGKTHALRVMAERLGRRPSEVVIYADLRILGDTRVQRPQERAAVFLRQLLQLVQRELVNRSGSGYAFANARKAMAQFEKVLAEQGFALRELTSERTSGESGETSARAGVKVSPTSAGVSAGVEAKEGFHETDKDSRTFVPVEQVDFTAVAVALKDVSQAAGLKRLTLLLDEWSEVKPIQAQVYLADYIKHVFFAVDGASVKIAAIQHRSRTRGVDVGGAEIGFEENQDVFAVTMLDEQAFSYDRDPQRVEAMLEQLLYRHLAVELARAAERGDLLPGPPPPRPHFLKRLFQHEAAPAEDVVVRVADALRRPGWGERFFADIGDEFMRERFAVATPDELVAAMFDGAAFSELARGAQGVPREFLNVLSRAVFDPGRQGKLDVRAIRAGLLTAQGTKLKGLEGPEKAMLSALIRTVTAQGARCFLADHQLADDETFQALVDERLLHRLNSDVADPREPADIYDVYTLDYGSYVRMIAEGELRDDDLTAGLQAPAGGRLSPFGDGRYIRRVIVTRDALDLT